MTDAGAIAIVQVRSWQAAYRGLLPDEHLAGLDPQRRRARRERLLERQEWPRSGTLVAEGDEGVVGFADFCAYLGDDLPPETVGQLAAIYLLPAAWGRGVGRRLLAESVTKLSEAGYREAALWVLNTNTRARRFYEAGGWYADGAAQQETIGELLLNEVRYRRSLT
jgi:GNAT superfamily N-acetyltransferase